MKKRRGTKRETNRQSVSLPATLSNVRPFKLRFEDVPKKCDEKIRGTKRDELQQANKRTKCKQSKTKQS